MKRWEESIAVAGPGEKTFAYVSDFSKHGEWSGHGLQVTQVGGGPAAVGTKYATVAKQFGTQREQSTITELTPPCVFGWDSVGGLGQVHHAFGVREDAGNTVLTKSVAFVKPSFLAKMMMFRLKRDMPKALGEDLVKIKARLEG